MLISTLAALVMAAGCATITGESENLSNVDHLVYATPDLARGVREIEQLLGVRAAPGGQHPGRGTRNALIALGPGVYLEIIGPDPDQPPPSSPRAFGLDDLKVSRLAGWAARSSDVDRLWAHAKANDIPLGAVKSGSRKRPDGALLSWRFTDSAAVVADGIVPFFIDWGVSPHPSLTTPPGAVLVSLRAEHPDERRVRRMLETLGLQLPVKHAAHASLVAVINCPRGRIELR